MLIEWLLDRGADIVTNLVKHILVPDQGRQEQEEFSSHPDEKFA